MSELKSKGRRELRRERNMGKSIPGRGKSVQKCTLIGESNILLRN